MKPPPGGTQARQATQMASRPLVQASTQPHGTSYRRRQGRSHQCLLSISLGGERGRGLQRHGVTPKQKTHETRVTAFFHVSRPYVRSW